MPDLVELTRRAFDAASRRDFDRLMSFFRDDATWGAIALGARFEGVAAIRGFLESWLAPYEEYKIEPQQLVERGNGVVQVVALQEGRPAGGADSVRVREIWSYVLVWASGVCVQVDAYQDVDAARGAAERLADTAQPH